VTDTERAAHVEALFGQLSGASPEERSAALTEVGDPAVVAEVARLLAAHDEVSASGDGFAGGLHSRPVKALIDAEAAAGRKQIGRYPVVRRLGQGGMGVVCLAHDTLLDRPVAIKLLSPHLGGSPAAVRRLTTEARLISALDHPNIAAVHEIGETEDGQSFIVMGYYEGETLRERLDHGPLAVNEVLDIGIQLAEGLGAAHRAGITHRDIKPENVVLTTEGRAVILDFGIAKGATDLLTGGQMRGTVAYMSPEQSRGEDTDPRTDVWSTGVVLHELLTGSRPFPGDDRALVHAIREEPPVLLTPGRGVPPALTHVIESCLSKAPASRLRSGGELAAALRAVRDGRPPARSRRRRIAAVAAVALTVLAATALYLRHTRPPPQAVGLGMSSAPAPGIAVLPFEVRGDEHQIWREGMVDVLSVNLDGVEGLRGIDSRTVLALWAAHPGAPGSSLASALAVARDAGAQYAVLGSIVPFGRDLRIAVRVYSVSGTNALASFGVDGPADSLLSLVDQVTIKVLAAAWQGRQPTAEVNLGRITTRSVPALKSFLNGERLLRKADYAGAAAHYRDAIVADSGFAFAHYRFGMAQVWVDEAFDPAPSWQEALREAARLSVRLPERERLLVQLALAVNARTPARNSRATLELARLAVSRYPDEADAWYFLGDTYFHHGDQLLTSPEAADSAFQRALALDPARVMLYEHMIENAINASFDSARARNLLDVYSKSAAPDRVRQFELAFAFAFGDSAAQQQALDLHATLPEMERVRITLGLRDVRYADVQARALGDYGRWQSISAALAAERLLQLAIDRGDTEQALRHLAAPRLPPVLGALHAYRARLGRLPLPDSVYRATLAMPADSTAGFSMAVAGAVAAEDGRENEFESALGRLEAIQQRYRERADTGVVRFVGGTRTALRGYRLGHRGDRSRALDSLMTGQEDATGGESPTADAWNAILRWWIGDFMEQEGRLDDAARYFSSIRRDPFAAERVAPIYEQLGQLDRARESYLFVAEAWRDGNPVMQQRAAAARDAARRLASGAQGD